LVAADRADRAVADVDIGVAPASWTTLPLCNVSAGLSITQLLGISPAVISTPLPKSWSGWGGLERNHVAVAETPVLFWNTLPLGKLRLRCALLGSRQSA